MSATYTDRYIAAAVKHLPSDQHAEVEAELRSAIADAMEAPGADEATVLESMGDPERLAANYAERPLHLIGPRLYLQWKRLTVLLLWIVVPIVTVVTAIGGAIGDQGGWAVVGQTIGAAWITTVMIAFWVTVVFAALERFGGKEVDDLTTPWTVDRLPAGESPVVSWGETAVSAATIVLTGVLLVWQQLFPWVHATSGEGLPVINPDLWSFVLPALLLVMALELVVVIVRQVRGQWTMGDWWATLGINVATLALLLPPLLGHYFLNREAFAVIGWPDANAPFGLEGLELVIAAVIVIVALSDVIGGWLKARRASIR